MTSKEAITKLGRLIEPIKVLLQMPYGMIEGQTPLVE